MKVSAAHNNFHTKKSLEPLVLLFRPLQLSKDSSLHSLGPDEGFFVVALYIQEIMPLKPNKVGSRVLRAIRTYSLASLLILIIASTSLCLALINIVRNP